MTDLILTDGDIKALESKLGGARLREGCDYILLLQDQKIRGAERITDGDLLVELVASLALSYPDCEPVRARYADSAFIVLERFPQVR